MNLVLFAIVLSKTDKKWSATWNYEHILSFQTNLDVKWVGSVLYNGSVSVEDGEIITQLLRPMNCYPIFLDKATHDNFYNIFCKQKLWPIFRLSATILAKTIGFSQYFGLF